MRVFLTAVTLAEMGGLCWYIYVLNKAMYLHLDGMWLFVALMLISAWLFFALAFALLKLYWTSHTHLEVDDDATERLEYNDLHGDDLN